MASIFISFKLKFPCSDNEPEYEVLIICLISVLRTCNEEATFVAYQTVVQKLIKFFLSIHFEHASRVHNKHADALAILASKKSVFVTRQLM